MDLLSLNLDELLYRVHIYFFEPLWYVVSLKWIWGSSSAKLLQDANQLGVAQDAGFFDRLFGSSLFRIFASRPSVEPDSVEELLNPTADRSNLEFLFDILFGRNDKEGVIELLFTTPFGWLVLLGLVSFLLYVYFSAKSNFLSEKEKIIYDVVHKKETKQVAQDKATRWQTILAAVNSEEQNSWKIAVMDAEIMLEEVLSEQGYVGAGVAEQLKQVGPEHKGVVQYAWEAHKIRNQVAHQADFVLTQRDARKTISMYERFFSAFYGS